jgi:hypothetical protein
VPAWPTGRRRHHSRRRRPGGTLRPPCAWRLRRFEVDELVAGSAIRLAGRRLEVDLAAYYVAQEEGLFKKHGLDVRINTGPSG